VIQFYHCFLKTKDGILRPFDMAEEPYTEVFNTLLSRARSLEDDPKFVALLERLYLVLIVGPLAGKEVSVESA